ncbi:hypothetical protein PHYBOEH_000527 [Phytophthora boehmeriae]|uniref:WRKY19-like zinc finger domain-containing protein n=1 Tax=Phytophthora boehmeriae TaxID=109152 RepID=A0A8T1VCK0_9STRA|nr:hypothetical protein PHYBOEH_000527 [Phytophthora boehmeriae]
MFRKEIAQVQGPWDATTNATQSCAKSSLMFIMNAVDVSSTGWLSDYRDVQSVLELSRISSSQEKKKRPAKAAKAPTTRSKAKTLSYEEKRRSRECKIDGCANYIINKGLCFRHGGGKKCSVQDCPASAKNAGLCWRHGGSVKCTIEGCSRRGKSRGVCWAHGGGTKCSRDKCTKVAVSNGRCWAHGGGKRCAYDGCKKAAYERTHNYCVKHHDQLKDDKETLDV